MKRIDTGDPNVLEYRESIGWTVLLTLPLFVAVVGFGGLLWSDLLRDVLRNADGVVLLITGAFVLVALRKVLELVNDWFVCVGVVVDRAAGAVTKQWGLFVALPVQTYRLSEFTGFRIVRETTRSRGGSMTKYYLYLTGPGLSVKVGRADTAWELEKMADEIAGFMGLVFKKKRKCAARGASKGIFRLCSRRGLRGCLSGALSRRSSSVSPPRA
jgi:hypothetical protein